MAGIQQPSAAWWEPSYRIPVPLAGGAESGSSASEPNIYSSEGFERPWRSAKGACCTRLVLIGNAQRSGNIPGLIKHARSVLKNVW